MGVLFSRPEKRSAAWGVEPPIVPWANVDSVHGTDDSALTVSSVWACVSKIANAVSMLPLDAYTLSPAGVPRRGESTLLTNPAQGMTQSEWLHMLMVSLLLRGNAYGRIVARDELELPVQIELQSPDDVIVDVDRVTGAVTYKLGPLRKDITADIWHVRGMTMPGAKVGMSPISYAAATIGVDLSSRKFAQDFFTAGGIPKAVLTSDQFIDLDKANTLKARLLAATRNREPLVLGLGAKYQTISVSPEESQFLLTQQANVGDIARFFNLSPEMIGGSSGGNLAYSSPEMESLVFLRDCVSFWLKRIEDAVFGLLPRQEFGRFNTAALLRTDAKTQAEVDNMHLAGKTRVPSELRQRDGLPPMTDAQKSEADMVPLTVTPMGGAKALPALKEPPGPVAVVPVADQQNSAPHVHFHQGAQEIIVQPSAPAEVRQQINVAPSAAPQVTQDIHVAAPEFRLEQPITVQPATAPEVRMVTVASEPGQTVRTKRIERNSSGDITAIIEEPA